jgi:ABC-type nitrate/sulfonate/bicarbonate transport system substrate-binding protein
VSAVMQLGYRDRNVHELICHEVAVRSGSYQRRGVDVLAVPASEHPDAPLSAGLGGSLIETLKNQRSWRCALVHTVRPLFWVWGLLDGAAFVDVQTVAGHPDGSIVRALTEELFEDHGLPFPRLDAHRIPVGEQGDHDRLDLLISGAVDVAVLGTAFAPSMLVRRGLTQHAFFGDATRFPTAGIAVDTDLIAPDDPLVTAVVGAQREALELIKAQSPEAVDAIVALIPGASRDDAVQMLRDVVAPHYGPSRNEIETVADNALAWLSQLLTLDPRSAQHFYEETR